MRIALYQPDIPQNFGTMLRTAACFSLPVEVIEPCGFILDDRKLKRAGMDYIERSQYQRHASWEQFLTWKQEQHASSRIVLFSTKAKMPYTAFDFHQGDILLFGRESAGVPQEVYNRADAALTIPMQPSVRSLNVAVSAGMAIGEALRQIQKQKEG